MNNSRKINLKMQIVKKLIWGVIGLGMSIFNYLFKYNLYIYKLFIFYRYYLKY